MLGPVDPAWLLAALAFGYLLGSIPFGVLITRLAGLGDIRSIGSGNIGATNVLRTGSKALAAATLAGDLLKGTAAVLVADWWLGRDYALAAGLGAFVGHVFPVWLKFRGGKGVATFAGILLGLFSPAALAFGAIWIAVAAASRYSSVSALVASAATPFILYAFGLRPEAALFALLALILWIMHRANINRLIAGTEGRIGQAGSAAGD
ncbi:MAG TPA: glycerol-3-phosphate 1-O-acyltransferase PlsY [Xanthobacteraceae bacterium]|jgi:glycerol-3-phosphate acyltransferase PlsY